jgi:hypothetical protein
MVLAWIKGEASGAVGVDVPVISKPLPVSVTSSTNPFSTKVSAICRGDISDSSAASGTGWRRPSRHSLERWLSASRSDRLMARMSVATVFRNSVVEPPSLTFLFAREDVIGVVGMISLWTTHNDEDCNRETKESE